MGCLAFWSWTASRERTSIDGTACPKTWMNYTLSCTQVSSRNDKGITPS